MINRRGRGDRGTRAANESALTKPGKDRYAGLPSWVLYSCTAVGVAIAIAYGVTGNLLVSVAVFISAGYFILLDRVRPH